MKKMLGVALAAGLAFVPVSAIAADTVLGTVQEADIFSGTLTIRADNDPDNAMSFNVSEKVDFFELFLEPGHRVMIEYDKAQCGTTAGCMPTATKIEHNKG